MHRRTYLAGVAAGLTGLAGCLKRRDLPFVSPTPSAVTRTVSLIRIDKEPAEHDLALTVEILEPTVTPGHTATIQTVLENQGESRSRDVSRVLDEHPSVDKAYTPQRDYWLVPYEAEASDPTRCWSISPSRINGTTGPFVLGPGESVTTEFSLLDNSKHSPCMPTGEFHFGGSHGKDLPVEWLFTLSIENSA